VITNNGRTKAATMAPEIAHNSQLGKFAPAIVTIGSHAVKATIDKSKMGRISTAPPERRILTDLVLTRNDDAITQCENNAGFQRLAFGNLN
jgi:hypothetical protein